MEVTPYQHWLGGLTQRHSRFFLKLGDLESRWFETRLSTARIDRPIFVAGLARSGSTILLETLASHPQLGSHRYRDFPLLHIPIWWNWFLNRASHGKSAPVERSHKDGIYVTADSPEAMEEILWMAFFPQAHDPQVSNVLDGKNRNTRFDRFYGEHIRKLLIVRHASRYLSKGNYNVCRLRYLHSLFPDARFLIPVRDPVSHIGSLIKQHLLFCEEESQDSRVLAYMQCAGHFEFGLDRRPINFNDTAGVQKLLDCWMQHDEVGGWARSWAMTYSHVVECLESDGQFAEQTLLVRYDDLCQRPDRSLARIYDHCLLEVSNDVLARNASRIHAPSYYQPSLLHGEIERIHALTGDTWARLIHLCENDRQRSPNVSSAGHYSEHAW